MGRIRRLIVITAAALLLLAAAPSPADASYRYSYRSSDRTAYANWLQIDAPVDGIVGWHLGDMWVYRTGKNLGDAFVWIQDAYCPEGVNPSWGGGHIASDEPPVEPPPNDDPCTYDFRYGDGFGMEFKMANNLSSATLKGNLTIYGGHGGDPLGRPPVNMTWNGVGSTYQSSSTYRWRSDCCWESSSYKGKFRDAELTGNIGPMGFDPDLSGGSMSIQSSKSSGGGK